MYPQPQPQSATPGPQPALRRAHRPVPPRVRGLTLVELAVVLALVSLLAGLALPHWGESVARRHLEGAAAQLATDIQFARSAAAARNAPVRLAVPAGGSCYVVHSGPAGSCRCGSDTGQPAVCQAGAQALRAAWLPAGVRLSVNSASMLFDPSPGTVTPAGTLRVQGQGKQAVHHVVNVMGRVRSCSPAPGLAGYPSC